MNNIFDRLHAALIAGETATVLKIAEEVDELNRDGRIAVTPYPILTEEQLNSARKCDREAILERLRKAGEHEKALEEVESV